MKVILLCVFSLFLLHQTAGAQTYKIQGTVMAIEWPDTTPAVHALVTFTNVNDNSLLFTSLTDTAGRFQLDIVTSVDESGAELPSTFELAQNYPNPFSSETAIAYKLHEQSAVAIRIYNILGQEIRSFTEGIRNAGIHGIRWDGRDNAGRRVAPGVYFYQLQAGNEMQVKKMLFGFGNEDAIRFDGFRVPSDRSFSSARNILKKGLTDPRFFDIEITNTDSTSPEIIEEGYSFVFIDRDLKMDFIVETDASIIRPPAYDVIDYFPAWSPDSTTIAYVHIGEEEPGLYLIDADGGNKRRILSVSPSTPTWSPDGKWIAFSFGTQIYKIRLSDGHIEQLTTAGRNFFPAWSPDGEWIAYDRSLPDETGPGGIWIMRTDGKQKKAVLGGAYPTWHPENRSLLGVIAHPNGIGQGFVIYYPFNNIPPDTLDAAIGHSNQYPRYSPDGGKIAFVSQSRYQFPRIWVMNSDDTNPRELTDTQATTCDWSPCGEWIVYTDTRQGNGRLWLMRKDGTDKRQLTFE